MYYHKEKSGPFFEKIYLIFAMITGIKVLETKKEEFLIPNNLFAEEPNSDLFIVAKYFIDRFTALTRVLTIPGVPLDTNNVERAIKAIILIRNNSLFFNNVHSAKYSGDILSLTETTNNANINVFNYVDFLIENKEKVLKNPKNYLPWIYDKSEDEKNRYWDRVDAIIKAPSSFSGSEADESFHSSG